VQFPPGIESCAGPLVPHVMQPDLRRKKISTVVEYIAKSIDNAYEEDAHAHSRRHFRLTMPRGMQGFCTGPGLGDKRRCVSPSTRRSSSFRRFQDYATLLGA